MSRLSLYNKQNNNKIQLESLLPLEISELLKDYGIVYQQINWPYNSELLLHDLDEQQRLKQAVLPIDKYHQFPFSQLLILNKNYPNLDRLRMKYLSEYSIDSQEVFYLLEGDLLFGFQHQDQVVQVHCQPGSLLAIPAKVNRWLDIGRKNSSLVMMHFTEKQQEPVLHYTGSNIADQFPHLD